MDIAFRTNTTVINQLADMVSENDVKAIESQRLSFKNKISSLVIPTDGIIEGGRYIEGYLFSFWLF